MIDFVKYRDIENLPKEDFVKLSKDFFELHECLKSQPVDSTIKAIVAIFPTSNNEKTDSLEFYTFAQYSTAYSVIKKMAKVFSQFYLKRSLIPYITPLPSDFLDNPKSDLSPSLMKRFKERGVLIYAAQ